MRSLRKIKVDLYRRTPLRQNRTRYTIADQGLHDNEQKQRHTPEEVNIKLKHKAVGRIFLTSSRFFFRSFVCLVLTLSGPQSRFGDKRVTYSKYFVPKTGQYCSCYKA